MHTPVLRDEAILRLNVRLGGKFIDATYGEGGRTSEIISRGGIVLALDWDNENESRRTSSAEVSKLQVVNANYADIEAVAKKHNFNNVEGCLFDLGLSMEQINGSGRGFSYKKVEEPLDMRINSNDLSTTAADILNNSSQEEIYEIIASGGEAIDSRAIAEGIVGARRLRKFDSVGSLLELLQTVATGSELVKRQVFQALRIAVNHEYENIEKGIKGAINIIKPGGRLVVITFHQTEDRVVKRIMNDSRLKKIEKKPYVDKQGAKYELSAKLRVAEKI